MKIPIIVLFDNDSNGNKIAKDIYDFVENINEIETIIENIFIYHKKYFRCDYNDYDNYNDFFRDFFREIRKGYTNSKIYFNIMYTLNDKWFKYEVTNKLLETIWITQF